MTLYYDEEAIEVVRIGSTRQKAAQDYRCDGGCGQPIPAGVEYVRVATKVDGDMDTARYHPGCENVPPSGYCGCMGGSE